MSARTVGNGVGRGASNNAKAKRPDSDKLPCHALSTSMMAL